MTPLIIVAAFLGVLLFNTFVLWLVLRIGKKD